jgi:hypothetical protein
MELPCSSVKLGWGWGQERDRDRRGEKENEANPDRDGESHANQKKAADTTGPQEDLEPPKGPCAGHRKVATLEGTGTNTAAGQQRPGRVMEAGARLLLLPGKV